MADTAIDIKKIGASMLGGIQKQKFLPGMGTGGLSSVLSGVGGAIGAGAAIAGSTMLARGLDKDKKHGIGSTIAGAAILGLGGAGLGFAANSAGDKSQLLRSASNAFNLTSVAGRGIIGGAMMADAFTGHKGSGLGRGIAGAAILGHAGFGGIGMIKNKDFGAYHTLINGAKKGTGALGKIHTNPTGTVK